jgi:4,5-dihydroxyphthalate decarboxylase
MGRPADTLVFRTNLGDHPAVLPIKTGTLTAPGIAFDFCGPKSPPAGFKDMVQRGAYDLGELAIGTYLQAVVYDKPLMLLPITITARLQHAMIVCRRQDRFDPHELAGRRVGVRAYTQTTGIWVRAILSEDYGVDADAITWMCADGAHLAEYRDPPNVHHIDPAHGDLAELLATGRIDAAIFGADMPKDRDFVPLIPDPDAAARNWLARHRYVPVNHLLAIGRDIAESHPEQVRALYRLFSAAKAQAPTDRSGIDFLPLGFDALRAPVEAMIEHCLDQKIIPRRLSFDAVFGQARRLLDA